MKWERKATVFYVFNSVLVDFEGTFGGYQWDSYRCSRRRPYIFASTIYHRVRSRVYRVTQLRTDGVHCRESVGTGLVALKVVRVTSPAFASPWTKCYCAPLFSPTHYWYTVSTLKLSGVYPNISTAVVYRAVLFCRTVFSPRLMVCTRVKSSVYTVQYHRMLYFKT